MSSKGATAEANAAPNAVEHRQATDADATAHIPDRRFCLCCWECDGMPFNPLKGITKTDLHLEAAQKAYAQDGNTYGDAFVEVIGCCACAGAAVYIAHLLQCAGSGLASITDWEKLFDEWWCTPAKLGLLGIRPGAATTTLINALKARKAAITFSRNLPLVQNFDSSLAQSSSTLHVPEGLQQMAAKWGHPLTGLPSTREVVIKSALALSVALRCSCDKCKQPGDAHSPVMDLFFSAKQCISHVREGDAHRTSLVFERAFASLAEAEKFLADRGGRVVCRVMPNGHKWSCDAQGRAAGGRVGRGDDVTEVGLSGRTTVLHVCIPGAVRHASGMR